MADGFGYLKFPAFPVLDNGGAIVKFGDTVLQGVIGKLEEPVEPAGFVLPTHGGTPILQFRYKGTDAPYTLAPVRFSIELLFRFEDDIIGLTQHARSGLPFLMLMNWPLQDSWSIKAASGVQTLWRTSRRVSWGLTGITHATHPPQAFIDGTSQTIITSGTPIAGEVKVPTTQTAGQNFETIETPALASGSTLVLLYWPEWVIRVSGAVNSVPVANGWFFAAQLEDIPSGVYSA